MARVPATQHRAFVHQRSLRGRRNRRAFSRADHPRRARGRLQAQLLRAVGGRGGATAMWHAHARRHEAARGPGCAGRRRLGKRLARARLPELDDQDRPRHLRQGRAPDRHWRRLVGAVHHARQRARARRTLPAGDLLPDGRQRSAAHRGGGAVGRPRRQGGAFRDARVPAGQGRGRAGTLLRGPAARLVRRLPRARRPRVHGGHAGVRALPHGKGRVCGRRRHLLAL